MLRLAAGMRARPGMRMPAAFAHGRRAGGMRFATHGGLAGMASGAAPLIYLAAAQPQPWHFQLNWRGQIQLVRELSLAFFERMLQARAPGMVERLLGRLAPRIRLDGGRAPSQRSIVERGHRQGQASLAAGLAALRALVAPGAARSPRARDRDRAQTQTQTNEPASMPGHQAGWPLRRQSAALRAVALPHLVSMLRDRVLGFGSWFDRPAAQRATLQYPAIPFSQAWPMAAENGVGTGRSNVLLRHVLETLQLFRAGMPDHADAAAYGMAGTTDAPGLTLTRMPRAPAGLALRSLLSSRWLSALRGGEPVLRWLRAFASPRGAEPASANAWLRHLQARAASVAGQVTQSLHALAQRGVPASRPLPFALRGMALSRQLWHHRFFAAAPGGMAASDVPRAVPGMPAASSFAPQLRLASWRSGRASHEGANGSIPSFMARLSRMFRLDPAQRLRTSRFVRELLGAAAAGAEQENGGVAPLVLQTAAARNEIAQPRMGGLPAWSRAASQEQASPTSLALRSSMSLQAPWLQRQAALPLLQVYEPALATAHARNDPPAVMTYRETPRPPEPFGPRQVQRIEQQITRNIVHDITRSMPWRGDMEKAVLTPRVMRELAEQVGGMMAQRIGLERYRRGL